MESRDFISFSGNESNLNNIEHTKVENYAYDFLFKRIKNGNNWAKQSKYSS